MAVVDRRLLVCPAFICGVRTSASRFIAGVRAVGGARLARQGARFAVTLPPAAGPAPRPWSASGKRL